MTQSKELAIPEKSQDLFTKKAYPFRQPGEVRVTVKIAPERVQGMG